jgi:RNA polymerase sigma-70 factor (ECF subfamily)
MTATLGLMPETGNETREQWSATHEWETESEFLANLRAGNADAWDEFVQKYGDRMYTVARRMLRTEFDSADAVQEAFLSFIRALDSFEGQSRIWTWLYRILINVCLGKLRSRSRRPTTSIENLLPKFDEIGVHAGLVSNPTARSSRIDGNFGRPGSQPEDELTREEIQALVRGCIDQLPEPYRTVLILRDMEQLDTEQTGRILGLSLGAVKTRLHRARQALRTLLEPVIFKTQSA